MYKVGMDVARDFEPVMQNMAAKSDQGLLALAERDIPRIIRIHYHLPVVPHHPSGFQLDVTNQARMCAASASSDSGLARPPYANEIASPPRESLMPVTVPAPHTDVGPPTAIATTTAAPAKASTLQR